MQLNKIQIQNLLALLKNGKFQLNVDEATVLVVLNQELNNGLEELNKAESPKPKNN